MAVRIEDAGFEIRDMIAWVYGSGFPKSHDISKAIDKAAGAEREVVGQYTVSRDMSGGSWADLHGIPNTAKQHDITAPATDAARQWQGWGTALKPALEPITVARKPFPGTVAANVLAHGTGGLNVDGCRVGTNGETPKGSGKPCPNGNADMMSRAIGKAGGNVTPDAGRWPANLIHDGSEEVVGLFPVTTSGGSNGTRKAGPYSNERTWSVSETPGTSVTNGLPPDSGSAARFFYCAKASKRDRDEGCEGMPLQASYMVENGSKTAAAANGVRYDRTTRQRNNHPTVKPTALMRYLCRLVTPPKGIVLDPFMGSGSTGKAAALEGFQFIGIEREAEYAQIAKTRIERETAQKQLL
jgi:site-specific DNA-methyltransferase (adenine-specific)